MVRDLLLQCFNSLQVSYKQKTGKVVYEQQKMVSIPYRLATNRVAKPGATLLALFQFLIGQLQTHTAGAGGGTPLVKFQFLIGQLQTPCYYHERQRPEWFQFLIGQLQTKNIRVLILLYFLVSIPYRLATNQRNFQKITRRVRSFQFLIGQLQTDGYTVNGNEIYWFQFLIGQLQTQVPKIRLFISIHVSIPYRLATNRDKRQGVGFYRKVSIPYRLATN